MQGVRSKYQAEGDGEAEEERVSSHPRAAAP